MDLTVGERKQQDPVPEKSYAGRCVGIFDLGKQWHPTYKWKSKVLFMFEIPQVRAKFELESGEKINRPRIVSRMYGRTWSDRGLLKPMITAWRGSSYAVGEVVKFKEYLSKPATIQIVHGKDGEKVYSNVASVTEIMEGVKVPDQETDAMWFQFKDHETFESVETALEELPEWVSWIVDKIKASQEYENIKGKSQEQEETTMPESDDDIPF